MDKPPLIPGRAKQSDATKNMKSMREVVEAAGHPMVINTVLAETKMHIGKLGLSQIHLKGEHTSLSPKAVVGSGGAR